MTKNSLPALHISVPKIIEFLFDALYLVVIAVLGIYILIGPTTAVGTIWGVMALILMIGDAFHLLPRMAAALSRKKERYLSAQGIGKLSTSITMTLFYLLLWHCGLLVFSLRLPLGTALMYALTIIRILLCLSPRNGWTQLRPSYKWAIFRNIPFLLQGIIVLWLYARYGTIAPALDLMWLAIALSFLFYLPVVLFAGRHPKLGMLMLPKSCTYVWIVVMGTVL